MPTIIHLSPLKPILLLAVVIIFSHHSPSDASLLFVDASPSLSISGDVTTSCLRAGFVASRTARGIPLSGKRNYIQLYDRRVASNPWQRSSRSLYTPPVWTPTRSQPHQSKSSSSLASAATALSNFNPCNNAVSNIAAGGTLLLSTLIGIIFETCITKSSGGHVITLLSAALLSNISQALCRINSNIPRVPTDHFLYDWCWSVFLPASLVFALLSSPTSENRKSTTTTKFQQKDANNSVNDTTTKTILGMALPFFLGSIGSILGCIASFTLVKMPSVTNTLHAKSTSAILAGCLCASYIGGTVNFFAAAKLLTPLLNDNIICIGDGASPMGSMFGSMAAADLVVMAIYFAMLSAASKMTWLHRLFPNRSAEEMAADQRDENGDFHTVTEEFYKNKKSVISDGNDAKNALTLTAIVFATSMALSSVSIATWLEKIVSSFPSPFNPPGTMCAFLAMLGLLSERFIGVVFQFLTKRMQQSSSRVESHLYNSIKQIATISPTLSDLCFYLLFAAVGTSADISSALSGGPMSLAFASFALMIHSAIVVVGTLFGTRLGRRLRNVIKTILGRSTKFKWPRSSWEEILTASNAAIGGPATAAAFAAGLVPKGVSEGSKDSGGEGRDSYRRALVVGATVWGVFGYSVATSIGVSLTQMLIR